MGNLIFIAIIVTSFWVLFDAKSIGVKKGQIDGIANMGPYGWFVACLLLWIIGFPMYLAKRNEYKLINSGKISTKQVKFTADGDPIEQLEKLKALREKGTISEIEFEKRKSILLEKI